MSLVGAGRRGAPAASGGGLLGSVGVGFGFVPLGVDLVDHRSLAGIGVGRGRCGRPPASATAATAPPPLLRGCGRGAVRRGLGLRRFRLGVGTGSLRSACSLRGLIGGGRGRARSGRPASTRLPGPLRRLRLRGAVRLDRRLRGGRAVDRPLGGGALGVAGSVARGSCGGARGAFQISASLVLVLPLRPTARMAFVP